MTTIQHVFSGEGAPSAAPGSIGAHYTDTATGDQYLSKGTASAADWILQENGGAAAAAIAALKLEADPLPQYLQKEAGKGLSTNDYSAEDKQAVDALAADGAVLHVTESLTVDASHNGGHIVMTSENPLNLTVSPQAAGGWSARSRLDIEKGGDGVITIKAGDGVTINVKASKMPEIDETHGVGRLKRTAENVWTLFGDLANFRAPGTLQYVVGRQAVFEVDWGSLTYRSFDLSPFDVIPSLGAVSPNGRFVAVRTAETTTHAWHQVVVIDMSANALHGATPGSATHSGYFFSPDSNYLYYTTSNWLGRLPLNPWSPMDMVGVTVAAALFKGGSISDDGKYILLCEPSKLRIVTDNGGTLTDTQSSYLSSYNQPHFAAGSYNYVDGTNISSLAVRDASAPGVAGTPIPAITLPQTLLDRGLSNTASQISTSLSPDQSKVYIQIKNTVDTGAAIIVDVATGSVLHALLGVYLARPLWSADGAYFITGREVIDVATGEVFDSLFPRAALPLGAIVSSTSYGRKAAVSTPPAIAIAQDVFDFETNPVTGDANATLDTTVKKSGASSLKVAFGPADAGDTVVTTATSDPVTLTETGVIALDVRCVIADGDAMVEVYRQSDDVLIGATPWAYETDSVTADGWERLRVSEPQGGGLEYKTFSAGDQVYFKFIAEHWLESSSSDGAWFDNLQVEADA